MEFGIWCLVLGVWCLGFGVWCLGFGVWGLKFGVWGSGFGAWGLWLVARGLGFGVRGFRDTRDGRGRHDAHQVGRQAFVEASHPLQPHYLFRNMEFRGCIKPRDSRCYTAESTGVTRS
ncbi:hypothetical protein T484DRAFT_3644632 [Baffinella frigidus]|nr:hypothetical protein T484DRAFT_3644632 [Cryptophyta sp. CCMP2293]